jgi:predicted phosphodiesterase
MHVALISDIHGNRVSLDAVLADIDHTGVDRIICLGDVAALGPQPTLVIARLRELGCPCVMGNHDEHLLRPELVQGLTRWVADMTEWCAAQLSEADRAYLRSFQPLTEIGLGPQTTLLCYHGSPRSHEERILSTTPSADLDGMLGDRTATVMAGGHNHVQMMRRHRNASVIDVGSVGQPFEEMPFHGTPRFLPWAEYAIVGWVRGTLSVDLRRVPIDLDAVRRAAKESDMPGADEWADSWVAPSRGG